MKRVRGGRRFCDLVVSYRKKLDRGEVLPRGAVSERE